MRGSASPAVPRRADGFRHEALFYAGDPGFLAGTLPFIRDGLARGEEMLVVVSGPKIDLLRARLGDGARRVHFADMTEVGANPARIIPAWRDFVEEHRSNGVPMRGLGEPIWAGRRPAELVECQQHEALLNVEFADDPALWLICPYDVEALGPEMIDEACRTHPYLRHGRTGAASVAYGSGGMYVTSLDDPLPGPPEQADELVFTDESLDAVRRLISRRATAAGVPAGRTVDLVLAVNEVATNSVVHGGGGGVLRIWETADALVCEVCDGGRIDRPMVGRQRPPADRESGRGLWLANQLCDLLQVRSSTAGTVVRLYSWLE